MKIFWSWQSDTPEQIGKYLVRDALKVAINRLKQAEDIDEPTRDDLHLDQDTQGTTGSPDLVPTIFGKTEKSEVVVADVTIVGKTDEDKRLINSNVAIELGYALRACTDARVLPKRKTGDRRDVPRVFSQKVKENRCNVPSVPSLWSFTPPLPTLRFPERTGVALRLDRAHDNHQNSNLLFRLR
jgi:hypothetical protein